jgi:hypothetical protein
MIVAKSKANAEKVAPKFPTLLSECDVIHLLPRVNHPDEVYGHLKPHMDRIATMFTCTSHPLPFSAKRVYAVLQDQETGNMFHVTQFFSTDRGVEKLPRCDLEEGEELSGIKYTAGFHHSSQKKPKLCAVIDVEESVKARLETPGRPHVTVSMCGLPNKKSVEIIEKWDSLGDILFMSKERGESTEFAHVPGMASISPVRLTFCGVIAMGLSE